MRTGGNNRALLLSVLFAAAALATEIPAGTEMQIRLVTPLDTATAKAKKTVEAVLIAPVLADGSIVIPAGTKLLGQVKDFRLASGSEERAELALQFSELLDGKGKKAPVSAIIKGIDNAREAVDDKGRILGIVTKQTITGQLDAGINKIAQRYPGLGDVLGVAKESVIKEADPNIAYEPGAEMTLQLTKPLTWTDRAEAPELRDIQPHEAIVQLVLDQPFRTFAQRPPKPSDVTNLMFIGSREQLEEAFREAGWSSAAALDSRSKLETFRAIAELRGYKEAPVSILLLDDRAPDLVFQKQLNTFAQRHHLRIWQRPERFNNQDVWVCAATHDIGIDFSEANKTFIHKIDPQIDRERAKVVNDLLFTKRVRALALVDRSQVPTTGFNATGDQFQTDAKMAVLEF